MNGKSKIKWYTRDVNEVIFSQPYIKPKVIGTVLGRSSRTTLSKLLEELAAARILTPKKERGKQPFGIFLCLIQITCLIPELQSNTYL